MDYKKYWTAQQDLLRKALSSKSHFNEAINLFLLQHAAVHSAHISTGTAWSLHDEALQGMSEAQLKKIPRPGQNSIAWLLWHITRIEDMTINSLMLGQSQVWNSDWAARLIYSRPDCGASMDENEVSNLSAQISIENLLEYRASVGRKTRECIVNLSADQAREIVPSSIVHKLVEEGSITPQANWLFEYYTNRSRGFFLTRTATSHNFIHLNEAARIRAKMIGMA